MQIYSPVKGLKKLRSGKPVVRTPHSRGKPRCEKCGFRVRGEKHEEGYHHQNASKGGKIGPFPRKQRR